MKKLQFSIVINASREKVWNILWGNDTYPQWTAVFAEGSGVTTDWQEGSKAVFHDCKGNGMVAKIEKRTDPEFMGLRHLGMVMDGKEIMDGPEVDSWKGAQEEYTLNETEEGTSLVVDIDTTEDMLVYFEKAWPQALQKVKDLAENQDGI